MTKLSRVERLRALASEAAFVREQVRARGIRGAAQVDDVTAEVLAAAALVIDRFEPPSGRDVRTALRSWLYGFARNLASHARDRAYLKHEQLEADPDNTSDAPSPEGVAEAREALVHLLAHVEALPPRQRDVMLAIASDESIAEYAARTGVPLSTAHRDAVLARAKLQSGK